MVLNPELYAALHKNFGDVRVTNPDVKRIVRTRRGEADIVVERGEHYNVSCPCCGDTRKRLSISYTLLTKRWYERSACTHLFHCYNEHCDFKDSKYWDQLLEDYELAKQGLLEVKIPEKTSGRRRQNYSISLPKGLQPLHELSDSHIAIRFVRNKYNIPVEYMSKVYGASFTGERDKQFPLVKNRIVFPIHNLEGKLVAWQARSIYLDVEPRWLLPPGFMPTFYNGYRVPPHATPVVCEGIPACIASGPTAVAIFTNLINRIKAQEFSERWSTVIIATDPDTFVPDNRPGGHGRVYAKELKEVLSEFIKDVRSIRWPQELLDLATRKNNNEDVSVPDAADIGIHKMHKLLQRVK